MEGGTAPSRTSSVFVGYPPAGRVSREERASTIPAAPVSRKPGCVRWTRCDSRKLGLSLGLSKDCRLQLLVTAAAGSGPPAAPDLSVPKATDHVVVHHADSLHEGVADRRADEPEAAPLEIAAQGL